MMQADRDIHILRHIVQYCNQIDATDSFCAKHRGS